MQPLRDQLHQRLPQALATGTLVGTNLLVFAAMLLGGAGLWHSSNGVQLAWGANFGPATQDGEWWRLGSAMFLHFGILHLALNMWALWDCGQLVERMYGHWRFVLIYFISGLAGNLLSLVSHGGKAVSGGASGAIFGIYGALLVFVILERRNLQRGEFRWLFWSALIFTVVSIAFGFLIPGIDNAAHSGGLLAGILISPLLAMPLGGGGGLARSLKWLAGTAFSLAIAGLIANLPEPAYRWSDEQQVRQEINTFLRDDAAISRSWESLLNDARRRGISFEDLASRFDSTVSDRYQESFEELSSIPDNPALPSAETIKRLRHYAGLRRDASRAFSEGLRTQNTSQLRSALELARKSKEMSLSENKDPARP